MARRFVVRLVLLEEVSREPTPDGRGDSVGQLMVALGPVLHDEPPFVIPPIYPPGKPVESLKECYWESCPGLPGQHGFDRESLKDAIVQGDAAWWVAQQARGEELKAEMDRKKEAAGS